MQENELISNEDFLDIEITSEDEGDEEITLLE